MPPPVIPTAQGDWCSQQPHTLTTAHIPRPLETRVQRGFPADLGRQHSNPPTDVNTQTSTSSGQPRWQPTTYPQGLAGPSKERSHNTSATREIPVQPGKQRDCQCLRCRVSGTSVQLPTHTLAQLPMLWLERQYGAQCLSIRAALRGHALPNSTATTTPCKCGGA
jgi:hypothetical protein